MIVAILLYLLAMLVNSTVYIQYISTLPLTMKDAGLATIWYSGVVALNGFLVITCELLVTKVIQRWPIKVTMATGFALLGGGLSLYALPWGVAIFFIGCLVWTMAEMVGGPDHVRLSRASPPRLICAVVTSRSMQLMFNLGGAVGPGLGVFLYDAIGLNVWWCCGLASLVALILAVSSMVKPTAAGGRRTRAGRCRRCFGGAAGTRVARCCRRGRARGLGRGVPAGGSSRVNRGATVNRSTVNSAQLQPHAASPVPVDEFSVGAQASSEGR